MGKGRTSRHWCQCDIRLLTGNVGCSQVGEQLLRDSEQNYFQPGIAFLARQPISSKWMQVECQVPTARCAGSAGLGNGFAVTAVRCGSGETHQRVLSDRGTCNKDPNSCTVVKCFSMRRWKRKPSSCLEAGRCLDWTIQPDSLGEGRVEVVPCVSDDPRKAVTCVSW